LVRPFITRPIIQKHNTMETNQNTNREMSREQMNEVEKRKSNRGFAAMSPERQRQIASLGGRAAHQQGTAHEWSSEEARAAGRKGGQARGTLGRNGSDGQNR
jgi:uncharacterized protein